MKTSGNIESKLSEILKSDGLETPSDQFSDQLTRSILQTYEKSLVEESTFSKWLGKAIVAILVCFNVSFLIYLTSLSVQPFLIPSLGAFVLGLWGLLALLKKRHTSSVNAIS